MSFKVYLLLFLHLAVVFAAENDLNLIRLQEETLHKLRLKADDLLTAVSYLDFEIFNEYQCAIECIKDKSLCTGYIYDPSSKTCSLFNDASRAVDADVIKVVRSFVQFVSHRRPVFSSPLAKSTENDALRKHPMQTGSHLHGT